MCEYEWKMFGWIAQGLFAGRMIVQWWASERCGRSVVPNAFWYLSLIGGSMLLAYTIHIGDLVLIVGAASGLIVYVRNVALLHKHRTTGPSQEVATAAKSVEAATVVLINAADAAERKARAA